MTTVPRPASVPMTDVLAFAEALRTALTLPVDTDARVLIGRMAEIRGVLAAVTEDGAPLPPATRVLARVAAQEVPGA